MTSTPEIANRAGTRAWPLVKALSLLAIAALQMPCASAATPVDGQATRTGADDTGRNTPLPRATLAPDKKYGGNCVECHGQDLEGVVGKRAPDLNGRATQYGGGNIDSAPNEVFMIAGGVSVSAVLGLFLLGFFGAREPLHPADPGQSRDGKGMWES
jgi:mono/diheme cytochrome c family protein